MLILLNLFCFIVYYYIKFYFEFYILLNFIFFYINSMGLNINMFSYFIFDNFFITELFDNIFFYKLNFTKVIQLDVFFSFNFKLNSVFWILHFEYIYVYLIYYFTIFLLIYYFFKTLNKIVKYNYFLFIANIFYLYNFLKTSNYNFLYQAWYKFARNQKNTYLAFRFRLVYLNKKFVKREILNDNIYNDDIQEYFILKKKTFFDSHFKPTKIRKFVPLVNLRRKFYSNYRQKYTLKGLLFFYFKDYEDRINNKEAQQKTLRIYEGIYGTYIYQELLKKEDQKQAKFVQMKLNRA
jgi:hypothetical protein